MRNLTFICIILSFLFTASITQAKEHKKREKDGSSSHDGDVPKTRHPRRAA